MTVDVDDRIASDQESTDGKIKIACLGGVLLSDREWLIRLSLLIYSSSSSETV